MKFSELRKKRNETPIPVELEGGESVDLYIPSMEGVRKVHEMSAELKKKDEAEQIERGAELAAWMLKACTKEGMTIEEAEQAIYDTGGVGGPVSLKAAELVYGKEARAALSTDPTSSDAPSESTPST